MKKLLFLIAITAILCGCDKTFTNDGDITGEFWYRTSYYESYQESGKTIVLDSNNGFVSDEKSITSIHFQKKSRAEVCINNSSNVSTYRYELDLENKKLFLYRTYEGVAKYEFSIQQFTDNVLVLEHTSIIDGQEKVLGNRYSNVSRWDGKVYCSSI